MHIFSINVWRRKWQPTPVLLPGEFHGQRSLAGYSPWGHKESDTTEQLTHTQAVLSLFCVGVRVCSDFTGSHGLSNFLNTT